MTAALDQPYPMNPPPDVPKDLIPIWRCMFCATGQHKSCPGAVRNGKANRLILCYCCRREPRCLTCGQADASEVNPHTWGCLDQLGCDGRVRVRVENSPLFRMIQLCKVDAIVRRRAVNASAERITRAVGPEGDTFDEPYVKPKRPPRASSGVCACPCEGVTKGGEFLPGHDAKMKSLLRKAAKSGDMDAQQALEARGW